MELPKPYSLLMPFRGHRVVVQVHNHVYGELPAVMQEGTDPVMLPTTRLYTTRVDKASPACTVDVTCAQPRAMLDPFLRAGALIGRTVEFKARGRGRARRDSIHISGEK